MKRLEEIKNQVAKEHGYESYKDVVDILEIPFLMIDEIIKLYACEVTQTSLEKAAKQAKTFKNSNGGSWLDASIKEESITNEQNIVML